MQILNLYTFILGCLFVTSQIAVAQVNEPWNESQLMEPAELAERINNVQEGEVPLILAVNPDGMHNMAYEAGIKGAIWFGPAEKEENLQALEEYLEEMDRDAEVVLYCGCCPFRMCPNIRPAFDLLNRMGFTQHKLLNLPENIIDDWIDKGYPMKD